MFLRHIRMISEGSFDTEDWSNNAEFSFESQINFKVYSNRNQLI